MDPESGIEDFEDFQEKDSEKRWRLSYLKGQFECLQLHSLFSRYLERISHGYFSQFLLLQILLVSTHFITLLIASKPEAVVPDLILLISISVFSVLLLFITDLYVKDHPGLLKFLATGTLIAMFFTNLFIPFYYKGESDLHGNLRPAYTTYLLISSYILLNIHNTWAAFGLGMLISICHVATLILVTYESATQILHRVASDCIYLICINGLGIYFRYMNEIVIRRSFLDRRSCVQSTFQLKFEEEQENQLMSSIIPKHIIETVKTDIINSYDFNVQSLRQIPKHKPFKDLYVEFHENVTILFADIVNYTEMTTQLDIINLLETLNELFGRFDDASEKLKVLRIKFLGDCYYCVSGLPPDPAPNHAEACVDLGLKMISIIADIREQRQLNIDMRIGVHTGDISSGIIGSIKWQYDIWSKDVDIANKMESEGEKGKVHITRQTKDQLSKPYSINPSNKQVNGIETYLISPTEDVESYSRNGSLDGSIDNEVRRPSLYTKRSNGGDLRLQLNNMKHVGILNGDGPPLPQIDDEEIYDKFEGDVIDGIDFTIPFAKRYTFPDIVGNGVINMNRRLSSPTSNTSASGKVRRSAKPASRRRLTSDDVKRRTAFMNNNIRRYTERLELTNKELQETVENMRLSKYEQWFKNGEVNIALVCFKSLQQELRFITNPDPLFKYYLISEILLLVLVYVIQNLTLSRWSWPTWPFYVTIVVITTIFIPLTWVDHIWNKYIAKYQAGPTNVVLKFYSNFSKLVTRNVLLRIAIYTLVYIFFCLCVLTEWIHCPKISIFDDPNQNSVNKSSQELLTLWIRSIQEEDDIALETCIVPWHMTETCALAIIMSFLFLRMYLWLKFLYAALITILYSVLVTSLSGNFYEESQAFNYMLSPQISHVLSVVFLTITLHVVDRQTDYMNRLDHLWYETLTEKRKMANSVHMVNNMLLKNILPIHVAELYLNVNRNSTEELYNENYDGVAIMFASIVNYSVDDMGNQFLKTMNDIICAFDALSVSESYGRPIEKIKVAKWTYMAASGLAPGVGDTENIRRDHGNHVVISLIKFAARLLAKLKDLNEDAQQDMKLRIGISYGPIVAGVVGSRKPLYDIWGDAVNMASRMDTTGIPNQIQVLQSTAEIIERFGYQCHCRGLVNVKGLKKPAKTYFVGLDDNFELLSKIEAAVIKKPQQSDFN